jgi:hypothetical protein
MKRPLLTSLVTFGLLLLPFGMSRIGSERVPSLGLGVAQAQTTSPYAQFSADNQYWGDGNSWWTVQGCYSRPVQFDCEPKPTDQYCNRDGSWNDQGYTCYPHHQHMRSCYDKYGRSFRWWC